ncbi:branched-chain amino acid aminotransferase [Oscillospiraceae bacterium PP1C4]
MDIKVTLTDHPKTKPDESSLGFGKQFTDHMFLMDYTEGKGWHDPRIVPYGPISMDPASTVFHYAQEIFEGMKAYRTAEGEIQFFRPEENFKRLNDSCERMVIPKMDEELLLESLKQLVTVDKDWVPSAPNASLYIRPFIISNQVLLGVHPASNYLYCVILSPSGAYYKSGLNPVKIYVETKYVRAVKGGMGMVKTGGNYAASLIAQQEAEREGYSQVLWLDGVERKYIEEVGAMNVFFLIGDEIVTPALSGSILPGITRKSVIQLLKSWGMNVSERRLSIDELMEAVQKGTLKEAWGTGTAAVISPIGELKCNGEVTVINNNRIGEISQKLYDTLTGIQWGRTEDSFGWITPCCK